MPVRVYVLLLISFSFLFASAQRDKVVSDVLKEFNLKGQVKSLVEIREPVATNTAKENEEYISKIEGEFDKQGMISKKRSYWPDGEPFEIMDALYDSTGKRIQLKTLATRRFNVGQMPLNDTTILLKGGKRRQRKAEWVIAKYSENGTLQESCTFYSDTSVCSKAILLRDKDGKLYERDKVDALGEVVSKTIYTNDSLGRSVHTAYQKGKDSLYRHQVIVQDTLGKEIETYFFSPAGVVTLHCADKYSAAGNKIEYKCMDGSGKTSYIVKTVYSKFDKHGNWTYAEESRDGVLKDIATRKIEYQ